MLSKIQNYFNLNKRRRIARPKTLLLFGIFFLSIPIWNYIVVATYSHTSYLSFKLVMKNFQIIELIILVCSIIIGSGLLLVKRWGWYSFLIYAGVFILYNLYTFISNPILYNFGALVQTIIGFMAILYFLKKDISAPYFKMYPRGWRGEARRPVRKSIKVNGLNFKTKDISDTGLFVNWLECNLDLNSEVELEIENKKLKGGIVRIDDGGVGIAFRT